MRGVFKSAILCWYCWYLIALPGVLAAQDFDVDALQKQILATIEKVSPATVSIRSRGSGFSGVVVTPEGHVLSAGHAVRPGETYRVVFPDGKTYSAKGLGASADLDCALVKIEDGKDLPYVKMGDSSRLVPNQPCLSLSYPGGQNARNGPVVRFGRIIARSNRQGMIHSTALMEPGDSGGALFDLDGNVIGIHSRIGRSMTNNFDIPIDTFKKYWNQLNHPETFSAGPPVPKLGIVVEEQPGDAGIMVVEINEDSPAAQAGLKIDDTILRIRDRATDSIRRMRQALAEAARAKVETLEVVILRGDQEVTLTVPFELPKQTIAEARPFIAAEYDHAPQAIPQLARLPAQFASLEDRLDDCSLLISSIIGGKKQTCLGTAIANSPWVISKSTLVGEQPSFKAGADAITLEVIARDANNDLVLLRSSEPFRNGVDLNAAHTVQPEIGKLLITPDPNGAGLVSIWSSGEFTSRKRASRGYLGVVIVDSEQGALLQQVNEGAARNAGLSDGDIIVQMNDIKIKRRRDVTDFLATTDPNQTIQMRIRRGDEELEKPVTLGAFPSQSNHAADMMDKSGRRDGFSEVFSHDADVTPEQCGGPVFDWHGQFVGINIARNSRVRTFTVPADVLHEFLAKRGKGDGGL